MKKLEKNSDNQNLVALPHILVVDDDTRICALLSRFLRENGFVAMTASSAAEAREILDLFVFDMLVLDVMMPGETGLEFTKYIRAHHSALPVLLLTALAETENKIAGFESGADDYLPKPFEPKELLLRMQAILRRTWSMPSEAPAQKMMIGSWAYDPAQPYLEKGGESIKLTTMEVNLIGALLKNPGQPMSRDDLAAACGLDAGERTIDVQVTRLRRKIEEDTKNPRFLQTVRGKGYLLRVQAVS